MKIHRIWSWFGVAIIAMLCIYVLAPQMVKVTVYKLSLLPAAACLLYAMDCTFLGIRPHALFDQARRLRDEAGNEPEDSVKRYDKLRRAEALEHAGSRRLDRRALLFSCGLIAVALGS